MVSKKNKRKIVYEGTNYYWYVRINEHGHRVHIISDDKKVHLEYPFLDTEIPVWIYVNTLDKKSRKVMLLF